MTKKIENISEALTEFENAASNHADATEKGDYKSANKNYGRIIKAVAYIKEHNSITELNKLLSHSSVGVRLWASTYILPISEVDAIKTLSSIIKSNSIHSLTAETTLSEWKKGNLKL